MNELYAEASAKKKTTMGVVALKCIAIFVIIIIILASIFAGGAISRIMLMLGGAGLVGLIWYWPRFKVEWEYVFCDGQIDFDMILGGEKRKSVMKIDLEEADIVAKMDSPKMDGYRHLKARDFSSLRPDHTKYGVVVKEKDEKIVIIFEPNEKMCEMMKTKAPSKVEYLG